MKLRLFSLLAVALAFLAQPAAAQLEVCNKTPGSLNISIAYETDADIVSQGWWTIDPDQCQTVITTELNKPYYYHYAVSRALNVEWAGTFNFCLNDDPQFRINGVGDCEQRSFRTVGFRQVEVGGNKRFTLDISSGPAPAAAQTPAAVPAAAAPITAAPADAVPATAAPADTTAPAPAAPAEPAPAAPITAAPAPATPAPAAPAQ